MVESMMSGTTTTRTGTPSQPDRPTPVVADFWELWQRELALSRDVAAAWTAGLKWISSWYAVPWAGSVGSAHPSGGSGAATERATETTTAEFLDPESPIAGEAFDEVVHLLVDNDLSAAVQQGVAR